MFTGIITHLGTVKKKTQTDLTITTDKELINRLQQGASIAVDGICLTVVSKDETDFTINFMPETAKKTNIQYFQTGTEVNLELAATIETLFSGHIVQGHVDGTGTIKSIEEQGNSHLFTITIPEELNKYIVEKGSICLNGISLTVISVSATEFTVGIIPHTLQKTMLHAARVGDVVNLEVDAIAKYVEKIVQSK
ncbi:MAG TPA: riboflavin synthase [Candidatus Saccharimonadales bacterium]|nr:riboflavin synthase [Candidatus Saccharimonadales bacterium]